MPIDDQRTSERYNLDTPVVLQDYRTGKYYDGSIYNYSRGGMYIELDYPLNPGGLINIIMEKTDALPHGETCRARIVWCEEIPGAVVLYNYGIGVEYDQDVKPSTLEAKFYVINGGAQSRKCV